MKLQRMICREFVPLHNLEKPEASEKQATDAAGKSIKGINLLYNKDDTLQQITCAGSATPSVNFTWDPYYNRLTRMVDAMKQLPFLFSALFISAFISSYPWAAHCNNELGWVMFSYVISWPISAIGVFLGRISENLTGSWRIHQLTYAYSTLVFGTIWYFLLGVVIKRLIARVWNNSKSS